MNARTRIGAPAIALLFAAAGCERAATPAKPAGGATFAEAFGGGDPTGFARATAVPQLVFPQDHGAHPRFRLEWWYATANVATANGRRFGVELVFFRQALTAAPAPRAASWAARDAWMAHAAVTDVDAGRFLFAERLARGAGDMASVNAPDDEHRFELRCADWSMLGERTGTLLPLTLHAQDGERFVFDLTLQPGKPVVLQGDRGLSQKGPEPGNASIYYSLTRLPIVGTVRVDGAVHAVDGLAWIDREWSTTALDAGLIGWDWFSLQLDDGTDLMWYRLRRRGGASDAFSRGSLVDADGRATPLLPDAVEVAPIGSWRAPDGRAEYPARFRLRCAAPAFELEVEPVLQDQELHTAVRYYEGAVQVQGTHGGRAVRGRGYLEMTGYAR